MPSAAIIRIQIENSLSSRIPSALTPSTKSFRVVIPTGVQAVDHMLGGGIPVGTLIEIIGTECSGRTSLALSIASQCTRSDKFCAWIDVTDNLSPESAAASGMELTRLLWVRCGIPNAGASVSALPQHRARIQQSPAISLRAQPLQSCLSVQPAKPWARIEQALRSVDLLLQGGGFSCIVLDMGSIPPEYVSRIPLATWFRYRTAAEHTQASVLLLTQNPCANGSAALALRLHAEELPTSEDSVLTSVAHHVQISRQRFCSTVSNLAPLHSPQSSNHTSWQSITTSAPIR